MGERPGSAGTRAEGLGRGVDAHGGRDPSIPALDCTPVPNNEYVLPAPPRVSETLEIASTWAGHPVDQPLLTSGEDQYVAFYDADAVMTVAHRRLTEQSWTLQPLDSVLGWDSHNDLAMGIDRDGQIHVSGNMHNDPITYFRTTRAGDVTSLERVPVLLDAAIEGSVTYPRFVSAPGGELVFTFRDGSSGNGVTHWYAYDERSRTWAHLLPAAMFDGEGLRNAYPNAPVLGADGYFHLTWVWRETPDAATNSRLSYIRSADLRTWETVAGQVVQLPVRYETPGVVIDDVPTFSGLLNGLHRVGFDAQGRPTVTYHKYDGDGASQVFIARADQGNWSQAQVTHWHGRWQFGGGGSLHNEIELGETIPLPDGNVMLRYLAHGQPRALIMDSHTLEPFAEVLDPPGSYPAGAVAPESDYPGIEVQWSPDSGDGAGEFVLRWESMPPHRDRPREHWPQAQPLRLLRLG